MNKRQDLALVKASELTDLKPEELVLGEDQLKRLLKRTPKKYVKQRPAKGGGQWDYVTGGYVKKSLNIMFGWDWDFEIIDEQILIEAGEVVVKGKLTCRSNGHQIVKMQYGNKDIVFRNKMENGKKVKTNIPLSVGNDMKAAATDCLKKCAAEIGIAADIYNKEDFNEVVVLTTDDMMIQEIQDLFMELQEHIPEDMQVNIERVISAKEKYSYKKVLDFLKELKNGKG